MNNMKNCNPKEEAKHNHVIFLQKPGRICRQDV